MNGKKTQTPLASTYVIRLKKLIKTELGTVFLTTDNKRHLNEYTALMHESNLEDKREQDRRCETMKTNIAELVCMVLKNKKWGIFFKNEPMQSLPIQDNTTMFKVNEVREDELVDAIKQAVAERVNEWQHQTNQGQTEEQSSSGTSSISMDTEKKSEESRDL